MTPTATDTLSPEVLALLDQLRDIHLPEPIGWWPLAPGWWGLLALVLSAMLAGLIWSYLRQFTTRTMALRELEAISSDNPIEFANTISVLLRRVAIRKDASTGQLMDMGWADYLTRSGMGSDISYHLALAPYTAKLEGGPSADELRQAAAHWIRRAA